MAKSTSQGPAPRMKRGNICGSIFGGMDAE
jgi:hypothetical protein